MRMKQYKDDLISSCLQLVLALPNELVLCDIDLIIPVLKVSGILDRQRMILEELIRTYNTVDNELRSHKAIDLLQFVNKMQRAFNFIKSCNKSLLKSGLPQLAFGRPVTTC